MAVVEIDLKDAAKWVGVDLKNALHEGAMKGLLAAAQRMVQEIQTRIIPQVSPSPVARGVYRAGWKAEKTPDGAVVENVVPYAAAIEYGVRPGRVRPGPMVVQHLTDWVRMKGIAADEKTARRIANAIAMALKARGIFDRGRGLRVMERAGKELPKFIEAEVKREVERSLRRP